MFIIITKNVCHLQCMNRSPRDQTPCERWSPPWSHWCWTQVSGTHTCRCSRSCSSHVRCHHHPCQWLSPVSPPSPGTCSRSRGGDSWDMLGDWAMYSSTTNAPDDAFCSTQLGSTLYMLIAVGLNTSQISWDGPRLRRERSVKVSLNRPKD